MLPFFLWQLSVFEVPSKEKKSQPASLLHAEQQSSGLAVVIFLYAFTFVSVLRWKADASQSSARTALPATARMRKSLAMVSDARTIEL